jgi:CRP/FNR family transcriptional regulator, cyclic AMP receptor protein
VPTSKGPLAAPASKRPAIQRLSKVPLLSGLSRTHLATVAELAQEVRYSPGRMIVRAETPGQAFYVIESGEAKVLRGKISSAMGTWQLGPGDFFGELALLDGGLRSASVVAETELTTIRIERGAFRKLLKAEPELALKLLEGMALRMRGLMHTPSL